jgi:hypothetical protein
MKGKSRSDTLENFTILFIVIGTVILSFGIGLSVFTETTSMVVSVLGAWVAFLSTVFLILIWVIKELRSG